MLPSPSEDPGHPSPDAVVSRSSEPSLGRGSSADCRTCEVRFRCISWGWRSPAGIFFENAVILAPKPGCRGFVGRSADIRTHFGRSGTREAEH